MFTSRGESMGRRDSGSSSIEADPPCMGSGYICKQIFYKSLLKNQQWKNYNICCAAFIGICRFRFVQTGSKRSEPFGSKGFINDE
jgi:hypothetical protein